MTFLVEVSDPFAEVDRPERFECQSSVDVAQRLDELLDVGMEACIEAAELVAAGAPYAEDDDQGRTVTAWRVERVGVGS